MKRKLIGMIAVSLVVVGGICFAVSEYYKNKPFVFDNTSKNIGVYLGENGVNYNDTNDKNIRYFIKSYLFKDRGTNLSEKDRYFGVGISYYDQKHFLAREDGVARLQYDLFDVYTGQQVSKNCSIITSQGYLRSGNIISSVYPLQRVDNSSEQDICLYELGNENFESLKLYKYLKENETFVKRVNVDSYIMYTVYDYSFNTKKRTIRLSVFDKANTNKNVDNVYVRSIEVPY